MNRPADPMRSNQSTDDVLRQSLRAYAASVCAAGQVPPVSLVWFRAERRRRAEALRRAQRPVRIMQAIGLLCAVLAAAWGVAAAWGAFRFVPTVLIGALPARPEIAAPLLLLLTAGSGLVLLGCWGLLLASRQ